MWLHKIFQLLQRFRRALVADGPYGAKAAAVVLHLCGPGYVPPLFPPEATATSAAVVARAAGELDLGTGKIICRPHNQRAILPGAERRGPV